MPASSPWAVDPAAGTKSSFLGSLRKLARKTSNSSRHSHSHSAAPEPEQPTPIFRGPADLNPFSPDDIRGRSPSPLANPSPPTRRPDRPGMNAFTVPSNEPPPAYTASPTAASGPTFATGPSELETPVTPAPATTSSRAGEDPYSFLATFDTTLLIDDSGSMAGRSWREVSQALSTIAPIVTQYDKDGIDVYFLNHKSSDVGVPAEGIAAGGYRSIKRAETISDIFNRVRPGGGTPTGIRVHNILKPYLARLDIEMAAGREMKPLNLIVLTDGVPSDDVESVLLAAAKKLDKLDAPPFQVGVQFFQVGNEEGAREALQELDDELSSLVEGGVRDIVDTVTWAGGNSISQGGVGLTGDGILKTLLGSVVKRLDRRRASGEVRRT
ncbi:hypothetical protein B7494_g7508 [Chlorociboria aeruginascens]|nr:hypothetical protein B7494_g7508 [Chlorociboria aeruginascens]